MKKPPILPHRIHQATLVGIAVLLVWGIPGAARAQQAPGRPHVISAGGDPHTPDYILPRASGFRLFANANGAGIGGRGTGNFSFATDNYGPCDGALSGFCNFVVNSSNLGIVFQYFEIQASAGAPPSEYQKLLRYAPSLANAKGGGWTYLYNADLVGGEDEIGPADGSLGTLFSGVTSTSDGTCRDNTGFGNGFFPAGLPLLASSDCPPTWPRTGFGGGHAISEAAWETQFKQQGSAFHWNYWQVPHSLETSGTLLGDRLAAYGAMSDHRAEILADYGSAIPGGVGTPKSRGYPLGLDWHFDVFAFNDPTLASVVFWRATVVNRSADVYGTGVDYDSLYLGFEVGPSGPSDGVSDYFRPDLAGMVAHQSHVVSNGPCDDPARSAPVGVASCDGAAYVGRGYGFGGNAILILKSPIGDLRNKLFTRRVDGTPCTVGTDPFCDPSNPARGDTITFNHGHMCGYGGCWANTYAVNDRRSFGMISSTAANVIDGQTLYPGSFAYRAFHNEGYPAVLGKFNKYVPGLMGPPAGVWDYNHDGVPDTLYYDTCGSHGCVAQDGDTLANGLVNSYGNLGGVLSAGPFPLAAGDSTSWFVAFVGESDSVRTWKAIHAAINSYLELFPQPEPAPPPKVVATQVTPGTEGGANAQPRVTLVFDHTTEDWVDPYVERFADDQAADSALTAGQVSDIRARAADNVAALEIYKSCDGGKTFTADASCQPAPAIGVDGKPVGTGWQAYAVLPMLESPRHLPNTFTDTAVTAGRAYTYVVVTRTKGVTLPTPGGQTLPIAPVMRSALTAKTSLPQVAQVYVPVSRLAGAVPATVKVLARATTATVPFIVTPRSTVELNSYAARFGNRVVVDEIHGGASGALTTTRVTVGRLALAVDSGRTFKLNVFYDRHTYALAGPDSIAIGAPHLSATVIGDTARTVLNGLRFVLTQQGVPIYVSGDLALDSAGYAPGDALIGSRRDPGFTIDAAERLRGQLVREALFDSAGNSVTPDARAGRSVALLGQVLADTSGGGEYRFTWAGDPYNAPLGFAVDTAAPQTTRAEVAAALQRRPVASVGVTDATTAALLGVPQGDLVPVALPFTVYNETLHHPVRVAMVRQAGRTLRLGAESDTVRIAVPANIWVPGDTLWLLEDVVEDSIVRGSVQVMGQNGETLTTTHTVASRALVLGCRIPRPRCDPTASADSDGYVPIAPGSQSVLTFGRGFAAGDSIAFAITAPKTGLAGPVTQAMLEQIRVVPNPFVLYSAYQNTLDGSQILFTNMPAAGTLRIYTVAGQFVQQVTWTAADLDGSGDLHFDLKTRSGGEMATGLYIWVVTASPTAGFGTTESLRARGKLVVIRGSAVH